ncbi:hypothetical protein NA57DRAFT_61830 [Rhizodiscina lignyota]|uniref:Uncharacterized protein n=1 Tax=Rhizodiscina lignyota TaxID=1504668 RepID=A0A9P4I727_9PEZI|nr:hypothetical protein NA57DRAFT_61830 [Rhizodiscina lignyota]
MANTANELTIKILGDHEVLLLAYIAGYNVDDLLNAYKHGLERLRNPIRGVTQAAEATPRNPQSPETARTAASEPNPLDDSPLIGVDDKILESLEMDIEPISEELDTSPQHEQDRSPREQFGSSPLADQTRLPWPWSNYLKAKGKDLPRVTGKWLSWTRQEMEDLRDDNQRRNRYHVARIMEAKLGEKLEGTSDLFFSKETETGHSIWTPPSCTLTKPFSGPPRARVSGITCFAISRRLQGHQIPPSMPYIILRTPADAQPPAAEPSKNSPILAMRRHMFTLESRTLNIRSQSHAIQLLQRNTNGNGIIHWKF